MRNVLRFIASKPKQLAVAGLLAVLFAVPVTVSAFTGTYTGNGGPQFNIYSDVEGVGNEADFLRVGHKGAGSNEFVNNLATACEGEFDLWIYVHNGAPEGNNGTNFDGTGVAKNTKLSVVLPVGEAGVFTPRATISASNAAAVSDTATITCNDGSTATMSFVAGSASLYNNALGTVALPDSVVNGGTSLGYGSLNGVFPGCWQYRNWVKMTVKLTKKVKPVTPNYSCDMLALTVLGDRKDRKVSAKISYTASNGATFKSAVINWGDNQTSNGLEASHQYATDGTYTVTGTVKVTVDGKEVTAPGTCVQKVTFSSSPVVPPTPTELPNTGAGSTIGIFAAVSAAAAIVYQVVVRRRAMR